MFRFVLLILLAAAGCLAQEDQLRILAIGAHPDDCDIKFAGTAAKFARAGHAVKFLSVTNGDAGHHEMGGGILAMRRYKETQESARRLGIDEYEVLGNHDGELEPTLEVREQIIRAIREWNADIVIGPRPNDYHPDHRYTGMLMQDAAYMVVVPNIVSGTEALRKNPIFIYYQDRFEKPAPFEPYIAVAIDDVWQTKLNALDAHVSQFYEWLPWVDHKLDQVPADTKARKEWLGEQWASRVTPAVRATLERRYTAAGAAQVQHVEAFELCEYGRQPSWDELNRLFPK